MTRHAEPERTRAGRGLRFAARPSRRNSSGGFAAAVGGPAFPRRRVLPRQSPRRHALGGLA
jgi:hypothetical protein